MKNLQTNTKNTYTDWEKVTKEIAEFPYLIGLFIVVAGMSVLFVHAMPNILNWLTACVSCSLLAYASWSYISIRKSHTIRFLPSFLDLLYAIHDDPYNENYHNLLRKFEKFAGIRPAMMPSTIHKRLKRFPNILYVGGRKTCRSLDELVDIYLCASTIIQIGEDSH